MTGNLYLKPYPSRKESGALSAPVHSNAVFGRLRGALRHDAQPHPIGRRAARAMAGDEGACIVGGDSQIDSTSFSGASSQAAAPAKQLCRPIILGCCSSSKTLEGDGMEYLGYAVFAVYAGTCGAVAIVAAPATFIPPYRRALRRLLVG